MPGQVHHPRQKAAAIAALLTGESAHSVARRFDIPKTTVLRWRAQMDQDGPQKKEIGEQVLSWVEESIDTLRAQARFTRDRDWLLQQSARDIALLHGVMFDKMWHMLGAFRPGEAPEEM